MQSDLMPRGFAGLLMIGAAAAVVCSPAAAEQVKKSELYYMRKAFCEKEAAAMHFGLHPLKRYRYIKKCLAEMQK
jgi:hypothetical protein